MVAGSCARPGPGPSTDLPLSRLHATLPRASCTRPRTHRSSSAHARHPCHNPGALGLKRHSAAQSVGALGSDLSSREAGWARCASGTPRSCVPAVSSRLGAQAAGAHSPSSQLLILVTGTGQGPSYCGLRAVGPDCLLRAHRRGDPLLFKAVVYSSRGTILLLKMYLGQNLGTNSHSHEQASFCCWLH